MLNLSITNLPHRCDWRLAKSLRVTQMENEFIKWFTLTLVKYREKKTKAVLLVSFVADCRPGVKCRKRFVVCNLLFTLSLHYFYRWSAVRSLRFTLTVYPFLDFTYFLFSFTEICTTQIERFVSLYTKTIIHLSVGESGVTSTSVNNC